MGLLHWGCGGRRRMRGTCRMRVCSGSREGPGLPHAGLAVPLAGRPAWQQTAPPAPANQNTAPHNHAPPGMLYAGSLWLSNSAYLYLSVSFIQMTKSLMPGLVYGCGCLVGTEKFRGNVAANMALIAFGVVVCAVGELNLVARGLAQQLTALGFEVGWAGLSGAGCAGGYE